MIPTNKRVPFKFTTGKYLILTAGVFHVVVAILILIAGRLALFGGSFDARGLGSFAPDSGHYFGHASTLAATLRADSFSAWWTASFPVHIKLYSLSIAALGPLVGQNVLAVEPLNLVCFVTVLIVVFKLGQEIIDRRAGLVAAIAVALWPTFLLHSTQVLKDQLFIPGLI